MRGILTVKKSRSSLPGFRLVNRKLKGGGGEGGRVEGVRVGQKKKLYSSEDSNSRSQGRPPTPMRHARDTRGRHFSPFTCCHVDRDKHGRFFPGMHFRTGAKSTVMDRKKPEATRCAGFNFGTATECWLPSEITNPRHRHFESRETFGDEVADIHGNPRMTRISS